MLKALAVAAAVCSDDYFLVWFDVQQALRVAGSAPLFDLLLAELAVRHSRQDFDGRFGTLHLREASCAARAAAAGQSASDALAVLAGAAQPLRLGIVCDGIQHLFLRHAAASDPSVRLLCALEAFAKHTVSALLLLSGSSTSLRRLLFDTDRDLTFGQYRSLNRSLCNHYEISALRTAEALAPYLLHRYGREHRCYGGLSISDPSVVRRVLHETGGVAGLVHAAVGQLHPLEPPCAHLPAAQRLLPGGGASRLALIARSARTRGARTDPLHLAVEEWRAGRPAVLSPADVGSPYSAVVRELVACGQAADGEAARAVIEAWVDEGLAYVTRSAERTLEVQLARPADAQTYLTGAASQVDYARLCCVRRMAVGDIHGPPVHADYELTALALPCIHSLLPHPWRHAGESTAIHSGRVVVCVDGVQTAVTADSLAVLQGRTWLLEGGETGVTGMQFEVQAPPPAGGGTTVTLHGWRCKGGRASPQLCLEALQAHRHALAGAALRRAASTAAEPAVADEERDDESSDVGSSFDSDGSDAEEEDEGASTAASGAAGATLLPTQVRDVSRDLARAEAALLHVARCLAQLGGVQVVLGTLCLAVTGGSAAAAAEALAGVGPRIEIPGEHVAALCPGCDPTRLQCKGYTLQMHAGTAWLLGLLEPELRSLWVE